MDNSTISLDYNNMMYEKNYNDGFSEINIRDTNEKVREAISSFEKKRLEKQITWTDLHNDTKICDRILDLVEKYRSSDWMENFVVLGIGGSALGPIALHHAINSPYYNELSRSKRNNYPRFYVLDNIDPERLGYFFEAVDINKTLFNVISKSGKTVETMSQFMIVKKMLEDNLGKEKARERIICTTGKNDGDLAKIAGEENYEIFYIDDGVGGRFSVLSCVGLLPAGITGIDIRELLNGAKYFDGIYNSNPEKNFASVFAPLCYLAEKREKNILIMMPYADSLKYISGWSSQLYAESLGKKKEVLGKTTNYGQTLVGSLGATDQHSQLQLYSDGPNDKVIVFVGVKNYRHSIKIPKILDNEFKNIDFLCGITHNELIRAEKRATEFSLLKSQRLNMTIDLPRVDEFILGQLFYSLEISVSLIGEMLGINAFDQPGVEESKNSVCAILDCAGYENKKIDIEKSLIKNKKYIV
ncbi:MAG: glucose-6-phosphate isomerase [Clostridiales bacterium]|jgi:glucose-6-phosphate isomerase|nr:glucose-6-phosphate isomerase [Clostridiales bacterium]